MKDRIFMGWMFCCSYGCLEHRSPPSVDIVPGTPVVVSVPGASPSTSTSKPTPSATTPMEDTLGTVQDNLPFAPSGLKVASIAWRTWVYSDTSPKRERYGYLRVGAVVDARGPAIYNNECQGGWYRINPRGFICIGLGATLDLDQPLVLSSQVRPVRGSSLPYRYARADTPPPLSYTHFPSTEEMKELEQDPPEVRTQRFLERLHTQQLEHLLEPIEEPPEFLLGDRPLPRPYGVNPTIPNNKRESPFDAGNGFAFTHYYRWQGRLLGLTTDLDLIALDRTRLVNPSTFHGIPLEPDESLPIAVSLTPIWRYTRDERGNFVRQTQIPRREFIKLTGQTSGQNYYEAKDGTWVQGPLLRVITPPDPPPPFPTANRKWLDVSIETQTLVAYEGSRPVYATLVSTGKDGLKDPSRTHATIRGSFMIYEKDVSITMDNTEDKNDSFSLRDVPFVQYFQKGYALHGVYWHDGFGVARSHGCVNLSPQDAAWLFEWTDLVVPTGWHGVVIRERGTVVHVRP